MNTLLAQEGNTVVNLASGGPTSLVKLPNSLLTGSINSAGNTLLVVPLI